MHLIWRSRQQVRWRDTQFNGGFGGHCGHGHFIVSATPNDPKASALVTGSSTSNEGAKTMMRTLRLAASVSQTLRDREPILSVSFVASEEERLSISNRKRALELSGG